MNSRRDFLRNSITAAMGVSLISSIAAKPLKKVKRAGVQLYSVRKEMLADARGTLKKLAALGYQELESARSEKGNYYGLTAKEVKKICADLGMSMRSGHIHIDENFQKSIDEAGESGQEYLICSTMPTEGQTADNYKRVADAFNAAGARCAKSNIKFGYHNHAYEFERDNEQVLYDVLLKNTDPKLVHMELDLGWVIDAGKDPLDYFKRFPGRFPLWHLKDMDLQKKQSTEFGKGSLKIRDMLANSAASGMKYFFVEQEEYTSTALESLEADISFLKQLDY
jgi:sugar phosphate isomerase/epimerase